MWRRVIIPLAVVSVLWIGIGLGTGYYIQVIQFSSARMISDAMGAVDNAGKLESMVWRLQASVIETLQLGQASMPSQVRELEAAVERHLDTSAAHESDAEKRAILSAAYQDFETYKAAMQRGQQRTGIGVLDRASLIDATTQMAVALSDDCSRLADWEQRRLAASLESFARLTRAVAWLRLILIITGPLLGLLVGIYVTRGVRDWSSVYQLSVRLKDSAVGLEQEVGQVEISPTGELPALEHQVQEVSSRISRVVRDLEHARAKETRSERLAAVGELAAGVAHELRNPLTSVKLLLQTAEQRNREQPLSAKQFQVLMDEIGRMERTIQGLLDLSRPAKLVRVPHDVRETLRRAVNLVSARAAQQNVRILEGLPSAAVIIHADPGQLHQVFVNLLLNGVEAVGTGGVLRISFGGNGDDGSMCRIKFTDNGPGIPPQLIDQVFEPFVSNKEHGYGLGLAVSRRIVSDHGGSLSAANRPEGGAVFTVALPIRAEAHSANTPTGESPSQSGPPGTDIPQEERCRDVQAVSR